MTRSSTTRLVAFVGLLSSQGAQINPKEVVQGFAFNGFFEQGNVGLDSCRISYCGVLRSKSTATQQARCWWR